MKLGLTSLTALCLLASGCSRDTLSTPIDLSASSSGAGSTSHPPEPDASSTGGSAPDPDGTTTATTIAGTTSVGVGTGDPIDDPICDFWAQDCPTGHKCAPFSTAGEPTWDDYRCVGVVDDPAQLDEPCMNFDGPHGGVDDCDHGLICWEFGNTDDPPMCIEICTGTQSEPSCSIGNECDFTIDALHLCSPGCDPILQDCPEGEGCYAGTSSFWCRPDESGEGGNFGDPCELDRQCSPGLHCLGGPTVPGCTDEERCCTNFCDLTTADPDAACSHEDQICMPYLNQERDDDHVGFCTLPFPEGP